MLTSLELVAGSFFALGMLVGALSFKIMNDIANGLSKSRRENKRQQNQQPKIVNIHNHYPR